MVREIRAVALTWPDRLVSAFYYHATDEPGVRRAVAAKSDQFLKADWIPEPQYCPPRVARLSEAAVKLEEMGRCVRDDRRRMRAARAGAAE